jgi:hypothetical protein
MRRLLCLAFALSLAVGPALADAPSPAPIASPEGSAGVALVPAPPAIELAQSDCRGRCSSTRGYCLSTCRDSFCRAVCNDRYQDCVASCRRR